MGADPFFQYADGHDPAEAFRQSRRQALHEHGYGAYIGSITENDDYTVVTDRPLTPGDAKALARVLIACADSRIDDKRGPAGAIAVRTELRTIAVPGLQQPGYGLPLRGTDREAVLAVCRQRHLLYTDEIAAAARWSEETGSGEPPLGRACLTVRRNPTDRVVTPVPDGWLFFGWASS